MGEDCGVHYSVIPALQIIYLINEQTRKEHIMIFLCLFIKSFRGEEKEHSMYNGLIYAVDWLEHAVFLSLIKQSLID
jgi:hypothetical protein